MDTIRDAIISLYSSVLCLIKRANTQCSLPNYEQALCTQHAQSTMLPAFSVARPLLGVWKGL